MHPLTVFPSLLTYGLLSPLLLRVAVSIFILSIGYNRYKKPYKWSSIVYILSGLCILLGLYTQIAAIVGILVIKFDYYIDTKQIMQPKEKMVLYGLAGIILLSLLFTGPGFIAFDLPL